MLKVVLTAGLSALALTACATDYQAPSVPPPANWSGTAGLSPAGPDATKVNPGRRAEGDVVVETAMRYDRTGVVTQPVAYKGAFGGDRRIEPGTPAFAAQFSLMATQYGMTRSAQGTIDPIEWCTAPASGESACIFWEGPDRARYLDSYTDKISPLLYRPTDASGMVGPVPLIEERPVELGPVSRRLVVRRITERELELDVELHAGGTSVREDRRRVRWNPQGQVMVGVLGIPLRFTRQPLAAGGAPAVLVERVGG